MNTRVSIGEDFVFKRFSDAADASAALRRATALRAAGIATPRPARQDEHVLRFPRLHGQSGSGLRADLPRLIAPLRALQALPPDALNLPRLDPLRRIRPRRSIAPNLVAEAEALASAGQALGEGICHGDFHPGQVIVDADGRAWLLDLDDMALGPVEADLGNLVAWLATQPDAPALSDAITHARAAVRAAWSALDGTMDDMQLDLHARLALIRRALKRAERGDPSLLANLS